MFDYLNEFLLFSRGKRGSVYRQARALKARGDAYIFNQLCSEWSSRFKWTFEPEDGKKTIATELIEQTILFNSAVAFAKYTNSSGAFSETTWRNFRPSGMDNRSFYGYPNRCTLSNYAGEVMPRQYIPVQPQDTSAIADCAIVYDNYKRQNPMLTIIYYAERLSTINASINACIRNILGTTIISCSPEQADSILKQREAAAMGIPYILKYNSDTIASDDPRLMSTPGATEALKTLFSSFDKVHADFLQSIGVRVNNEIDKKSGVTPIEIVENRQNVDINLNDALNARKIGISHCERIGLRGLSVSLENFTGKVSDFDATGKRIEPMGAMGEDPASEPEPKEGGEVSDL